jgi:hypothetical protein
MDLSAIASRIAARSIESLTSPSTEYSARVELVFSVDFEGQVAKDILIKKLEDEVVAALESSIKITSRDLELRTGRVLVKPLKFSVAINDQSSFDEEIED